MQGGCPDNAVSKCARRSVDATLLADLTAEFLAQCVKRGLGGHTVNTQLLSEEFKNSLTPIMGIATPRPGPYPGLDHERVSSALVENVEQRQ